MKFSGNFLKVCLNKQLKEEMFSLFFSKGLRAFPVATLYLPISLGRNVLSVHLHKSKLFPTTAYRRTLGSIPKIIMRFCEKLCRAFPIFDVRISPWGACYNGINFSCCELRVKRKNHLIVV